MSTQAPVQNKLEGDYIEPMYIKEIDDPDGWKRPDSGYIPFWYARIAHTGKSPYHPNASTYKVYRNVKDYGVKGDGMTFEDDAIEAAMKDGGRCGHGCGSSTTQNAVLYFPPGTYLLSRPIQSYYGTTLLGDPNWRPVLKAHRNFTGIALVDENPYDDKGKAWYTNQVNFFRQTRNLVFDTRDQADGASGTGIHRPVSQGTALSNCHFEASRDPKNGQLGIIMEGGSGGNMGNLTFRGGNVGLNIGNQQFTCTDMRFEGQVKAAIKVSWGWALNFQNVAIRDVPVGVLAPTNATSTVDIRGSGQQTSSLLMVDWRLQNVTRALAISAAKSGVFTIENLRALCTPIIVASGNGNATATAESYNTTLAGSPDDWAIVPAWIQGAHVEHDRFGRWMQGAVEPVRRPPAMQHAAHGDQRWFTRSRPEYGDARIEDIIDVKSNGAKGDGVTDDTAALQLVLNRARDDQTHLVFIPHGVYIVTSTLRIHPNIRIVGEASSVLMGTGDFFNDVDDPQPVFQFGPRPTTKAGHRQQFQGPDEEEEEEDDAADDVSAHKRWNRQGIVEVSDIIFSTRGPAAGAIVVEWNFRAPQDAALQGTRGMWDSHIRLGGFRGSNLEGDVCPKAGLGSRTGDDMAPCRAAFLGFHFTRYASAYLSGTWVWLADHDLDRYVPGVSDQISLYSGRGIFVDNKRGGPIWMYGVGSEHHLLVQFNLHRARSVFMSVPQTETAYFQGTGWPSATETQPPRADFHDPRFRYPSAPTLNDSLTDPWYDRGLAIRIRKSKDVIIYGGASYSFFQNYTGGCADKSGACQRSMMSLERNGADSNVVLYNINTAGADSMVDVDHERIIPASFWRNGFTATVARWNVET
ncbi:hypothetical protein V8E36_005161 [Tilletia maclaganii]